MIHTQGQKERLCPPIRPPTLMPDKKRSQTGTEFKNMLVWVFARRFPSDPHFNLVACAQVAPFYGRDEVVHSSVLRFRQRSQTTTFTKWYKFAVYKGKTSDGNGRCHNGRLGSFWLLLQLASACSACRLQCVLTPPYGQTHHRRRLRCGLGIVCRPHHHPSRCLPSLHPQWMGIDRA